MFAAIETPEFLIYNNVFLMNNEAGHHLTTRGLQIGLGFMREIHPESEVALWFGITKAWLAYHEGCLANKSKQLSGIEPEVVVFLTSFPCLRSDWNPHEKMD